MSFQGHFATGQGQSYITLTPEVSSTTPSGVFWERSRMGSQTPLGGMGRKNEEEEAEEEEVWKRFRELTETGVPPTLAPCPSPAKFHLPAIPHSRSRPRRRDGGGKNGPKKAAAAAASNLLRALDPKVRFYVTATNASDYVTSGKSFSRCATPVWNRAPLGRSNSSGTAGSPQDVIQGRGDRGSAEGERGGGRGGAGGGGREGRQESVKLSLEVMKLNKSSSSEQAQNGHLPHSLVQGNDPGMDVLISQRNHHHSNNDDIDDHHHNNAMVNQDTDSGRPRGRSANYGSARRRLAFTAGEATSTESEEASRGDDAQFVHPFLRMYQTRPGAFARLLSRESDPKAMKIVPGSTIASLMVPHPVLAAGERADGEEEEVEEEEFAECVQGKTM